MASCRKCSCALEENMRGIVLVWQSTMCIYIRLNNMKTFASVTLEMPLSIVYITKLKVFRYCVPYT